MKISKYAHRKLGTGGKSAMYHCLVMTCYTFLVSSCSTVTASSYNSRDVLTRCIRSDYTQFDERRVDLDEPLTADSLSSFLGRHRHRLVTQHSDQTATTILYDNDSKRVLWLLVDGDSPDLDAHVHTLTDVAIAFRAQVRLSRNKYLYRYIHADILRRVLRI